MDTICGNQRNRWEGLVKSADGIGIAGYTRWYQTDASGRRMEKIIEEIHEQW